MDLGHLLPELERLLPLFGRLTAALVLGGAVGLQRERHRHPAGLRTHMLVALGAALITIIGDSYEGEGRDSGRIAAQIVSGIGFLGAGTIIRHGASIRGLTTAASLWTVAGIGMGAGRGGDMLWLTVFATFLTLLTLTVVDAIENAILGESLKRIMSVVCDPDAFPLVLAALTEASVAVSSVVRSPVDLTGAQQVSMHVRLPRRGVPDVILRNVLHVEGVRAVRWEDSGQTQVDTGTENDA